MIERWRQWWFEFQLKRGWKQYGRTKPREADSRGGGMGVTTKARVTFEAKVIRADGTVEDVGVLGQEFKEVPVAYLDGLRAESARQAGEID
jgi:hypothetical protein